MPVADEVPRQGVPVGPRQIGWAESLPASLLWVEALDGGDPMRKVEHRDHLRRADGPAFEPVDVLRTPQRCLGWYELDAGGDVLIVEHDRDRRWRTTSLASLAGAAPAIGRVLFDRSMHDAYGDQGTPLFRRSPDGRTTIQSDDGG
jgi:hypothetical protein